MNIRLPQCLTIGRALIFALLAACGGGGGAGVAPPTNPPPVTNSGLDSKPANLTCTAPVRPQSSTAISVTDGFPSLPNINAPVKLLVEPVANPRWFVLRKSGQLVVFDPGNATSTSNFLDLSSVVRTASEGGLLGMAFHPDYPAVPEIFLYYTRNHTGPNMRTVVSRFILDSLANPGAGTVEQVIIEVDQDFDNHNGGDIAFGADRLLYIGLGDGGSGNDPNNRAQDTTHLLGSMLRLDVIGTGADYNIPPGNPFSAMPDKCGPGSNVADCPEIYAWGLRNPWRWSFDRPTGDLWLGDVGQNAWEEVDIIANGGNYGWDCREGAHDALGTCIGPYIDPVAEYDHSNGDVSITGGFVYRGASINSLIGRYVFGDFASGRLWALQGSVAAGFTLEELANTPTQISSFGVDQAGEMYFTDYNAGRIMKIEPAGGAQDNVAELLSNSGCVDPTDITQPYSGLVPYAINAPFWSDGANKDRYIAIPDGETISIDANDDWVFPPGTVLVKNFRLNGQLIETRHLMRHPDGIWGGYTYEWNPGQTEATRVRGGRVVDIGGQDWIYPDEAECMRCHTNVATVALGPETAQLNMDFTYPSTGRTANQVETLDHIMMFASPAGDPAALPALPDVTDASIDIGDRARAYLHSNCASCHQPGGPTPVNIDLRYTTALADTNTCDVTPTAGGFGTMMPRIIAPGDANRSVLVLRMDTRGPLGMPPLGSTVVDSAGVTLITDWVNGLLNCN
jgi:uncharacterized repeat protein (TIGR03806 family)